jgi:hypothetical protein
MRNILILLVCLIFIGCSDRDDVYTLYKQYPGNSALSRVHVATFDSKDVKDLTELFGSYNMANCEIAQELFQKQEEFAMSGEKVKFWCEKGYYKK